MSEIEVLDYYWEKNREAIDLINLMKTLAVHLRIWIKPSEKILYLILRKHMQNFEEKNWRIGWWNSTYAEAFSKHSQISKMGRFVKMEFFAKIINGWKLPVQVDKLLQLRHGKKYHSDIFTYIQTYSGLLCLIQT